MALYETTWKDFRLPTGQEFAMAMCGYSKLVRHMTMGNDPIRRYLSSRLPDELRRKHGIEDLANAYCAVYHNWINNVGCAPEDDDTNYTVLALRILETYGPDFSPRNVAECWLASLPLLRTCTAERVAYRNLASLLAPPESATHRNPYREWIVAQIRADLYGYVAPGDPARASEMAWRDASVSHVRNGLYGAMFVAAMLSAASGTPGAGEILGVGLSLIPSRSRLALGVSEVPGWRRAGVSFEGAVDRLHERFDERDPHAGCHAVTNSMVVAVSLLYGELDFERSIGLAVQCAFDTDCNAATVGSIVGLRLGARELPERWTAPLKDRLESGLSGESSVTISELARRTVAVARRHFA
jgi:hypothetical protein